jgi:hypothetical protein
VHYWQIGRDRWLEVPSHIRRGFLRLYLALAIPWLAYFGYTVIDAGREYDRLQNKIQFDRDELAKPHVARVPHEPRNIFDVIPSTIDLEMVPVLKDQILELEDLKLEQGARGRFALKAIPIVPLGAPILFLVVAWVVSGFRRSAA